MTPTVQDRGGVICMDPPNGGFFVGFGDRLGALSVWSCGSSQVYKDGRVVAPPRSDLSVCSDRAGGGNAPPQIIDTLGRSILDV
jgi:hypothetical protein